MRVRQINLRKLWLSLLLLVGATAIAVPGIQEVMNGNVAKIGNTEYETLAEALEAAQDDDIVTLLQDIDATTFKKVATYYNFTINKSITLDGDGHSIKVADRGIAVNQGGTSTVNVTIKNLTVNNADKAGRAISTRGNIGKVVLDNVKINCTGGGNTQGFTVGGSQTTPQEIDIINGSEIHIGNAGYCIITFNPVSMNVEESTLDGWASIYPKGMDGSAGSKGSVFNIKNSNLISENVYSGNSNAFSLIKVEDDGVTINLLEGNTISISGTNNFQSIVATEAVTNNQGQYTDHETKGQIEICVVNISGGDFTMSGSAPFSIVSGSDDTSLNISGGNFTLPKNQEFTNQNGIVSISGGSFSADPSNYLAEGYKAVENNGTWTVQRISYVAQIGEGENAVKYESLADAFAAAADGNTVTLLKDVSLTDRLFVNAGAEPAYAGSNNRFATTSENKSITLDLNGNNVTSSSNIALAGGSLNIVNNGTANAEHGVISTTNAGLAPIEVRGTGDLTQKRTLTVGNGVTLSGAGYGLNVFGSNNEQKNVIDVNVNGTVNGTLFVLGNLKNAENEININVAGTVYVPDNGDDEASVGVALNGIATVNVNEGAQVSGETGIEVRAGNLVVNGGNITATASTYSEKKNGSGSCTKGAAVAVAQHTTKLPITATLNGGTLTGTKTLVVTDVEEIGLNEVTVKAADALANAETVIIPEGYKWLSNGTMSTLTEMPDVAQIGDVKHWYRQGLSDDQERYACRAGGYLRKCHRG